MSGLNWTSYPAYDTINVGYFSNNLPGLYTNAINYFNSPPTAINSGTLNTLQTSSSAINSNPAFSIFSSDGGTLRTAIKFSGYFCPTQTGDWTFNLGVESNPSDDFSILFIGTPGASISPSTTFTTVSAVPSNTAPIIYNIYSQTSNYSKTVRLTAGRFYPILMYYSQGGGGYIAGLSFSVAGGSVITDYTGYMSTIILPCFKEDTLILTSSGYQPIQDLRKGDLIKTLNHGFKAIDMIGSKNMYHLANTEHRIKHQLYKYSTSSYPELFEDLVLTGCHSILVEDFVDLAQKEKTIEINGDTYITDDKYRLPACADDNAVVYEELGEHTVYHIALENNDYYMNYGIFANGLLVESCSKRYLKELSGMTLC